MSVYFFLIMNLFILESLLSVDNAAVLAVMVKDLPLRQQKKALRYGLLGAYSFRGICLFIASWLIKILWLKIAGGLYLLYLVYGHFSAKGEIIEDTSNKKESKIYTAALKIGLSRLWATIVLVEIMDLAFSIDNIFAAVAISNIFWIVMTGVGIGILAMRFVAGGFVVLINKYKSLETSAFIVISLLGLKLIVSGIVDYIPNAGMIKSIIETHTFDYSFSGAMMIIFFIPLLFKNRNLKAKVIQYSTK